MTGFNSKRQAAQDKMELADAYASAVAATPNMPTPIERKLAVERIERARNALEAALEQQQAEPPQRKWVGLTDEEIREVNAQVSRIPPIDYTTFTYARAVETKLKEKNGY